MSDLRKRRRVGRNSMLREVEGKAGEGESAGVGEDGRSRRRKEGQRARRESRCEDGEGGSVRRRVVISLVGSVDEVVESRTAGERRFGTRRRFGEDHLHASILVRALGRVVLPVEACWWSKFMIVAVVRACHSPAVILAQTESDVGGARGGR